MLAGANRLKRKKDFERAFKQGRGFREGFLSFKAVENGSETTRFGFIVGQKVSKKATIRNKIKRRLRELVKDNLPRVKNGLDVVIITGRGVEKETLMETKENFNKLFQKGKLFHD